MIFSPPANISVRKIALPPIAGIEDVTGAVSRCIQSPLSCLPLSKLVHPGQQVAIGVSDSTRSCPDKLLLPPLLAELERSGIKPKDICILVATGMHRPSTLEEKKQQLGEEILSRYQALDHQADLSRGLARLGYIHDNIPAEINRLASEADLLIATGVVEPHQYAGYSGGGKTVAIGLAGEAVIQYTHSPKFLDLPGTKLGEVHHNPFQQAIRRLARLAGLRFVINVILNRRGEVAAVAAGEPETVHDTLVVKAKEWYTITIDHSYEVVVAGVGYPKDSNLYQLSRAASYLAGNPRSAVAPKGVIIIPGRCQEGPGYGVGEQRFFQLLRENAKLSSIRHKFNSLGTLAGEQRAYIMAQVFEYCTIIVAGADCPEVISEAGFVAVPGMDEALGWAENYIGHRLSEILLVPHALDNLVTVG